NPFIDNNITPTNIYNLSLHDALPILLLIYKVMIKIAHAIVKNKGLYTSNTPTLVATALPPLNPAKIGNTCPKIADNPINSTLTLDRKSTRLNSSHVSISYAVFCLKKK